MHLEIILPTDRTERTASSVVSKLYSLAYEDPISGSQLDNTSNIVGSIGVSAAYDSHIQYLTTKYQDLHISADSIYIMFLDPEVERVLLAGNFSTDGIGVTSQDAATATFTNSTFKNNTTLVSFNEFNLFTRANTNPPADLFRGCTNLSSINLLNASTISQTEFLESGITTVDAPNITTIGSYAFSSCMSLTTVVNLGNIISLPRGIFYNSKNLKSVVLPSSCTSIGSLSFQSNNGGLALETINLENVISIESEAFSNCQYLDIDVSDLQNCVSLGQHSFHSCFSIHGELYLPKLISLGDSCFRGCTKLSKVTCLGKITQISSNMFLKHPSSSTPLLTEVYIPYECTSIAKSAFLDCSNLTTLKLYTDSVDDWVEGETPTYTDLSRVTTFGEECFRNCSLLQLSVSDLTNATSIGNYAFLGVSLLSGNLNLPNLTGILGKSSFVNTHISSISSLGSVTEIQEHVFENTDISSITIPNSVKKCGSNIVSNTIVPEIIFPEGVEEITDGGFSTKNNSLTYIEIPSTVTKMGVFFHRSLESSQKNLCTVVIKATTPPELNYYNSLWLYTTGDKFAGIYVPDSSLTAYQNGANAWLHSSIQAKLKPISQLLTDNPTAWAKYNRTSTV